MKKVFKTSSAVFMSAAIAASAGAMSAVQVCAADPETYNLQMNPDKAAKDQAEHQYIAYQVFSGELGEIDGVKQLINLEWADGVNSAALLTALKANTAFGSGDANLFKDCDTAAKVALVLENFATNSAQVTTYLHRTYPVPVITS